MMLVSALTPAMRRSALRNLTKARALIEAGWVKGMEHQKHPEKGHLYCMLGAVKKADGVGEQAALILLGDTAHELYPARNKEAFTTQSKIFTFNDHRLTRKQQVLRVFDKAIAKLQDKS